jgi:hypothetical protein
VQRAIKQISRGWTNAFTVGVVCLSAALMAGPAAGRIDLFVTNGGDGKSDSVANLGAFALTPAGSLTDGDGVMTLVARRGLDVPQVTST